MVLLLRLFLVAIALGFVAPSSAWADTARERAGKHVIDGDQLKVQAEDAKSKGNSVQAQRLFRAAADEYQAAYDLVPHPLMLYNLAQVSRLSGDEQVALDFYQRFLESKPTGEAADFARAYVRILEKSLARDRGRQGDDDDAVGDDDDDDADDDDDDDSQNAVDDDDDDDDGDDDDDDDFGDGSGTQGDVTGATSDPGRSLRYTGLGLGAAGVISIAFGIKFGLDAQSISSCLTNYPQSCDKTFPEGQWTDEALLLEQEGQSASNKMLIFTGVGAAALVAGGVLYYMGDKKKAEAPRDDSSVVFTPNVGTHSVGLGVLGRF